MPILYLSIRSAENKKRRANCSQTTGERLVPSVASHGLVRLTIGWFDSASFNFLALLVNKSNKKLVFLKSQNIEKFEEKASRYRSENV